MSNQNLPPLEVYVPNTFLGLNDKNKTKGLLISVRALQSQALQFSVLLETGAFFTGLPANSILFNDTVNYLHDLSEMQMYDNIGSKIEVITLETLRRMPLTLKTNCGNIVKGKYLFSIDFIDGGFSRHPEQWKMFHAIESVAGHLYLYPQYRLQFKDEALCPKTNDKMPKYLANTTLWEVGK